jgi:TolA-binding protein
VHDWIALCCLLALFSCAYYNTFFVAKKSFRAAEKSIRQSRSETVSSDARRDYTTAIRQCRKVLQHHSGSRWVDDAIYLMAASYYGIGDYDSALIRLEELETSCPESKFRADALFLAGLARTKQRRFDQADSLFERVVEEYPDFKRKDEILFARAETAATLRDRPTATRRYGELARLYPKSDRVEDALERAGQLHFEESHYDSAAFYFERLFERTRGTEREIDATILFAQALVRLERAEEALDILNEIEPKESETRSTGVGQMRGAGDDVARIRLEQASALNRMALHDEAIEKLGEVVSQQGSGRAIEAQFQIGYTYETSLDSLEAARSAYDKIATMSGRSIFKQQAVQRSNALKSLAELQEKEGSGDEAQEARADAALRIAEILYLDRKLIDDAIRKYEEVEEQFPETRAASQAAYALAYLRWKEQGDSLGAQEDFRDLVTRYPASTQARGAIDLLARQQADTSGLFALLVTPEPETLAVASDSAGFALFDSLGFPVGDSLAAGIDTLGVLSPDSLALAASDSVVSIPLDSTAVASHKPRRPTWADSTGSATIDSLRRVTASRRAARDSLVRAREFERDRRQDLRDPDQRSPDQRTLDRGPLDPPPPDQPPVQEPGEPPDEPENPEDRESR